MRQEERSSSRPRVGRPPSPLAGEVETRILDAAAKVFFERGFDGASMDLIAETARAGKPTIYARYPDKAALFEASFLRRMENRNTRLATLRPRGETVEERLFEIGVALIKETLTEEFVALCRLAIGEARRWPDLSDSIMREARQRGALAITKLLSEEMEGVPWTGLDDPKALSAGRFFTEGVLLPFLLRALAQGNARELRTEIDAHVRDCVRFFLAGLRNGGLG